MSSTTKVLHQDNAALDAAFRAMSPLAQSILYARWGETESPYTDEEYALVHNVLYADLRVFVEAACKGSGSRGGFLYKLRSLNDWSLKQARAVANIAGGWKQDFDNTKSVRGSRSQANNGSLLRQEAATCYTCNLVFPTYKEMISHKDRAHTTDGKDHFCHLCSATIVHLAPGDKKVTGSQLHKWYQDHLDAQHGGKP